MTFVQSDLFEKVEGCFDWILFNPPYLPSEGSLDGSNMGRRREGRRGH